MENDTLDQRCLATGITHDWQFVVAAFGAQCWKCALCGEWVDELDDGLAG